MEERQDRAGQGERQRGIEGAPVSITEFLLSRIAEDEAESALMGGLPYYDGGWPLEHEEHIRAECVAKRAIVEMQAANDGDRHQPGFHYKAQLIEDVIRTLAAVYADHPDYRERWAPRG